MNTIEEVKKLKDKIFFTRRFATVVIFFMIIGGIWYLSGKKFGAEEKTTPLAEQQERVGMSGEENRDGGMSYAGALLAGTSAPLLDFTKSDYDAAFISDKLIVLYFYANWCLECRLEFPRMKAAFDQLSTDRVVGFRVNFNDSQTDADEKDLARQFGVAYQHTKIFLQNGERVLKSPEGWDQERYRTEINTFIASYE